MNYYKLPFYKSPTFYVLLLIFLCGIGFVYWSITKPISTPKLENTQNALNEQNNNTQIAQLIYKEGKIRKNVNNETVQLSLLDGFAENESLETYSNAKAIVSIDENTILRLDENTIVHFIQSDTGIKTFTIEQGQVFIINQNTSFPLSINENEIIVSQNGLLNIKVAQDITITSLNGNHTINDTQLEKNNALSISNNTLSENSSLSEDDIENNYWFSWNLEQNTQANISFNGENQAGLEDEITLSGYIQDKKVYLNWVHKNTTSFGYKIAYSSSDQDSISFDADSTHYISLSNANTDQFSDLENGTYTFQVALYDQENNTLPLKSNSIELELSDKEETVAYNIDYTESDTAIDVNWDIVTEKEFDTIKVLFEKGAKNLIYPENNATSVSKNITSKTFSELEPETVYSLRLCLFKNDNCVAYSPLKRMSTKKDTDISLDTTVTLEFNKTRGTLSWNITGPQQDLKTQLYISQYKNPSNSPDVKHDVSSRDTFLIDPPESTLYAQICIMEDLECLIKSNVIQIDPIENNQQSAGTGSISLKGNYIWGKVHIDWNTSNDLNESEGFYTLYSEKSGPRFPARANDDYQKLSSNTYQDTFTPQKKNTTYYVRVCSIKSGLCDVYSNEIQVFIPSE